MEQMETSKSWKESIAILLFFEFYSSNLIWQWEESDNLRVKFYYYITTSKMSFSSNWFRDLNQTHEYKYKYYIKALN